jgi:Ser/Thr protein kinase RdoA (MazF antagonist)
MTADIDNSVILKLCDIYGLEGEITQIDKVVNGHINNTYNITLNNRESGTAARYIVQQINSYVFRNPQIIMNNIKAITEWQRGKKNVASCDVLHFLETRNGDNHVVFDDGSFWRIANFIENTVTYNKVESAVFMRRTGYAFGNFQLLLSDMPHNMLADTIPDFHNTKKRIAAFFDKVNEDPCGRADSVAEEIEFFERHRERFSVIEDMRESGELPTRVIHNDTKCNNVLFDASTGEPRTVIDLDTVMPGLVAYDFGDAVRSAANYTDEDETDLTKVGLNMEYFESFTEGYMSAARSFLTPAEVKYLALSAPTITFELASRFLADHLDGDKYFRIHRPDHNLDRARCQIKLCRDMLDKYDAMCAVTEKYYK